MQHLCIVACYYHYSSLSQLVAETLVHFVLFCLLLFGMITMRCLLLFVFHILLLCVGNMHFSLTPPLLPLPSSSAGFSYCLNETKHVPTKKSLSLDRIFFFILVLVLWLILLQYQIWLHVCRKTHYVPFDTNLNLFRKNKNHPILSLCYFSWYSLPSVALVFLISEYENVTAFLLVVMSPNFDFNPCFKISRYLLSKFKKTISATFSIAFVLFIFSTATTANAQYACICVFQIVCLSFTKELPLEAILL